VPAVLVALLAVAQPAGVEIPFKLLPSRHMLLSVTLDGKGPYNLIFDTGAPLNLVNARVAKDAGLRKVKGGGGFGFGLFGGVQMVEVATLTTGGVTAARLPAVAMDHPTVRTISDAFADEYGPIEGIVGFPFFARFATTVDYQAKRIRLTPTGYTPGDYLGDLTGLLMSASERGKEPKVVAPLGLWGFSVKAAGDGEPGVLVEAVSAGGPAAAGGLRVGDRLLTLAGRWTDTVDDVFLAASQLKPGRAAKLAVKRGDETVTLSVEPVRGF
jgi:hypothetical protein